MSKEFELSREGDELHIEAVSPWFYRKVMRRDPAAQRQVVDEVSRVVGPDEQVLAKVAPDNRSIMRIACRLNLPIVGRPNPAFVPFGVSRSLVSRMITDPWFDLSYEAIFIATGKKLAGCVDKAQKQPYTRCEEVKNGNNEC